MPSAEQKLHDAWKHVDHAHAAHEPKQVMGIENTVHDADLKNKVAREPVYRVLCSCGEYVFIPVQDVMDHTDAPAEASAPPAGSSTK